MNTLNIRQSIETKYLCPTSTKGSRIKAECARGSITLHWDDALNTDENHIAAADALIARFLQEDATRYGQDAKKNPWGAPRSVGQIASGNYVHVFTA
jgi:hypothetical protein